MEYPTTSRSYASWDDILWQSAENTHIYLPFALHTRRLRGVNNTTRAPSQRQACGGVREALTRVSPRCSTHKHLSTYRG
jgi:hypothetical protein